MGEFELDLVKEIILLRRKLELKEDMIANLKNHVKALQDIIERQHSCIDHLLLVELGGDLNG